MNSKNNIFIGVAWPYVNGNLHVGHVAGYLLPADITARFYRLFGKEVLMVSGSDCFGTPITVEADKKQTTPEKIVQQYHSRNLKLFEALGLTFDLYTKTDTPNHKEITQKFLLAFWEKNLLEISTQKQYYSQSQNKFLPDRYVEGVCPHCNFGEARSDQCDNCGKLLDQNLINPVSKIDGKEVVLKDTKHLFIKWNELQKDIEKYFNKASVNWRKWVRGETNKWLTDGLAPRAVTRDLDWGVEIPKSIAKELEGADHKRIYVWFDAVIGYFSASVEWAAKNNTSWEDFWKNKNSSHYYFMGKDNLVFHTIFWPGQLMTYDSSLHLPDFPMINQYLNLEGKKFSKSRGVVVDTGEFIEKYGSDALRFYLTTIMPENSDSSFTWEDFFEKNNGVLVGHIGNYIHRTLSLYQDSNFGKNISNTVIKKISETLNNSIKSLQKSEFKNYYEQVESLSRFANGYFNDKKPWGTKKQNEETFLNDGGDLIILTFAIASLLEPITPNATQNYLRITGINKNELWKNSDNLASYLNEIINQIQIEKPKPLFQKFEDKP